LYLLAACQKYDMASVQLSIRAEVQRGEFPAPKGAEAFAGYAIASAKYLIPEMENAARLTLVHPMTLENLGEELGLFEGWALHDLVKFRRRCRDNLVTCLDSFLEVEPPGPSSIWVGCPEVMPTRAPRERYKQHRILPTWLSQLLSRNQNDLKLQKFTYPLDIDSRIPREYFKALQTHLDCKFCLGVHATRGLPFITELRDKLEQAGDKVTHSLYLFEYHEIHFS
jgi:hypothetical protein